MFISVRNALTFLTLLGLVLAVPASTSAQSMKRVSLGLNGAEGNEDSFSPKISADGRFIIFRSFANNLVANDTNTQEDLFQIEVATGSVKRINVTSAGGQVTGALVGYAISADGRFVAFSTTAPGLVSGDANALADVFVRDTVNNTTSRVSTGIGADVNGSSIVPSISGDGRYVAYESTATNLVAGDTNGVRDVFVYDRTTSTTTLLSKSRGGTLANARSFNAIVSANGNAVAFYSDASNLVAGDTNVAGDVFVRDLAANTVDIVSVSTSGAQGNGISGADDIALSADGKLIAFDSSATNLVAGDTNARLDVFLRNLTVPNAPTTTRISVSTAGVQGDGLSYLDTITPDGRYIVFDSSSTNFSTPDTNMSFDVFLHERATGTTTRVSVAAGNVEGDAESSFGDISADGSRLAFSSFATNLVPNDTNSFVDVFLRTFADTSVGLTGTLALEGIAPTAPNQTLTFTFLSGGTQIVKTVSVSASGAFVIAGLPRAGYSVLISGGSYLSKGFYIDLSGGNVTLANPIPVRTGDGTRDNSADILDLLILIAAYNQTSPAREYNASVDFNLDGTNDVLDLMLIIGNYNTSGDSLP